MVDLDALSVEELEQLRDACNRRILELQRTPRRTLPEMLRLLEEVKRTLDDQGKEWKSLERWQWVDGEIRFWLNPKDQMRYQLGWFSIDELIDWSHDRGAILRAFEDDDLEEDEWSVDGGVKITWLPGSSVEH